MILNFNNTVNTDWDMGLAELIEENPVISDSQPTRFMEEAASNSNYTQVFMKRQVPSWLKAKSQAA